MLRQALCGVAIVLSAVAAPSAADACSCLEYRARAVWPPAHAADVAVDVTLVVQVSRTVGVVSRLTDDTGADVPLTRVRALEADDEGCALYDYLFLRPSADLAPGRLYTLTTGFPETNADPAVASSLAFTTGTAKRKPAPAPAVEVSLFAQLIAGQRWLQVFAAATSEEPVFIRAVGEATAVVEALGGHLPERIGIPLAQIACASVELVDATGATFRSANLCDPTKCLTTTTISATSCSEHPGGESWARWQEVPDGCGPPSAPADADGGVDGADGGLGGGRAGSAKAGGGGCALSAGGADEARACLPLVLVFLALALRDALRSRPHR